jgi:protein involved in sex pheromone biosynthesis
MKKDISIAVMATILILQLISNTVGGFIGDVADKAADMLQTRIQVEEMYRLGE